MAAAIYSHAFLVGSFNGIVVPQNLINGGWKLMKLSEDDYNYRLSMYYKSHVDAMAEAEGVVKPAFLNEVHHYQYSYQHITKDSHGYDRIEILGGSVSISLKKGDNTIVYPLTICNLDLFMFPHDIVLVSIEFDDSNIDLDLLTLAHNKLVNWETNIKDIADENLTAHLSPLAKLLPDEDISKLVKDGNNLKIFQIIQGEDEKPNDERLFEIGTFSPINSVKGNTENSLSEEYFNRIMAENSVSTYYNWRGLALVDSFTVLGGIDFEKKIWQWINLYYPLVYLRCMVEKVFCFSRNNEYRLEENDNYKRKTLQELSDEISDMEKFYFYNDFSYNFQPNLIYEAIVKGLDIKAEREELSIQIKERAKEEEARIKEQMAIDSQRQKEDEEQRKTKEENRRSLITIVLSAFAVVSIFCDLNSLIKDAYTGEDNHIPAIILLWASPIAIIIIVALHFVLKKLSQNEGNKNKK